MFIVLSQRTSYSIMTGQIVLRPSVLHEKRTRMTPIQEKLASPRTVRCFECNPNVVNDGNDDSINRV